MLRSKEQFASILDAHVPLAGKRVLEIGCGAGHYTSQLAPLCGELVAIDPRADAIDEARAKLVLPNVSFRVLSAEQLSGLREGEFQVVIFTLSLHHVPLARMTQAIDEGLRVADPTGHLVFLEPDQEGSFFEAELYFMACDGDEREAKAHAYRAILEHPRLVGVAELPDQTEFCWESLGDFVATMHPEANPSQLESYLQAHGYTLTARRWLNIFTIAP